MWGRWCVDFVCVEVFGFGCGKVLYLCGGGVSILCVPRCSNLCVPRCSIYVGEVCQFCVCQGARICVCQGAPFMWVWTPRGCVGCLDAEIGRVRGGQCLGQCGVQLAKASRELIGVYLRFTYLRTLWP